MAKHLSKKQREELASKHSGRKNRRREGTRDMFYSFLIVCEGTKTEPDYFRHFTTRRSKVVIIGADRSTNKLVEETLKRRDLDTYDYKWVAFDKDDNQDFNEAIELAGRNGIMCAWSNEAFELWFCLHFIDLTTAVSRKQYIEILEREIRKFIPDFVYTKGGDQMFEILRRYGNQEDAKSRARKLRELFPDKNYAQHNPCTMVDVLVEQLEEKCGRQPAKQ